MARRHRGHPLRRVLLFLIFILFCVGFFHWSNHSLQVQRFTFTSPRLPAGFDGCVIVQLSDLHGALFGEDNRDLLKVVAKNRPDYIFLTGDLLDQYRATPHSYAVSLGGALADIAPTYFVTGNHEWALGSKTVKELKALLGESGVTVLSNRWEAVERNGDRLALAGVDDPNGYADQTTPEELYAWIQEDSPGLFTLLLAHRNDRFPQYAAAGYGFVLSGHGHGGIVRLPFLGGLIGTNRRLFPQWTSGLYAQGDSVLFVSRGLGNNTVPFQGFRIFNRPELAVVTLKS